MKQVVFHSSASSAFYLSTAPEGVVHGLRLPRDAVKQFWRESPCTWGSPKGSDPCVRVALGGASVPHRVENRACTPPMVCSRLPAALSEFPNTEVDFEAPSWITAMQQIEEDGSPERQVYKATLVSALCSCLLLFCSSHDLLASYA